MTKRIVLIAMLLASTACAAETAAALMAAATAEASSAHKNVLVVFHASWCGWCRKFDAMLADRKVGPLLARHFVVAKIDVLEHEEKAALNTPGGEEVMAAVGGKGQGLPFLAIVDSAARPIVNSIRQPENKNIGYPGEPEEIAWFMTMLKRSVPGLEPAEAAAVENWLRRQAR
jgi:hypothetical protein